MKQPKLKLNIMDRIDLSDLIRVHVWQPMPGNFQASIECLEDGKELFIDPNALIEMNRAITRQTQERSLHPADPKTTKYIEEFVTKFVSELYRNGLAEIDEIKAAKVDHYADLRKMFKG